jgi:gas vesicle protein
MQISSTLPKPTVRRSSKRRDLPKNNRDGYIPGNWAPPLEQPKVSFFGRVNPDRAAMNLRRIGQDLLQGDKTSVAEAENVSKQIHSSAKSDLLADTSKEWMEMVANWNDNSRGVMMPLSSVQKLLKEHGRFREISTGTVTLRNDEHNKEVAEVSSLQSSDNPRGPGVVSVTYTEPLYTGLRLEGSPYPDATALRSLYFVDDMSKVQGLTGESSGPIDQVRNRMGTLLNSLADNSSLELTNRTRGYGDVGRSYQPILKTGGADIHMAHQALALAAAGEVVVRDTLGVNHPVPSRPEHQPWDPKIGERLKSVAFVGGAAAIMAGGGALFGAFLPTPLPFAGVMTGIMAGIGALAGPDDRATYDHTIPGARERFYETQSRHRKMGFLGGAAVGATFMAGATYGLAGAAVATGLAALGGAILITPE